MKTTPALPLVQAARAGVLLERVQDYVELTKPRIGAFVLVTVAAGAFLAAGGVPDLGILAAALVGTALVAGGASALNHWLERAVDGRMPRTAARPLPAGRLEPIQAAVFGAVAIVAGAAYLAWAVNAATMWVALLSAFLYAGVYTPLKRHTPLNTVIGAVPGALPAVIGWSAIDGTVRPESAILFLVVFLWQFPHFLAISWLFQHEYQAAGLRMLPTTELGRRLVGLAVFGHAVVLVPVSLLPSFLKLAGPIYFFGALVLGLQLLAYSGAFLARQTQGSARQLLWGSLVYLPAVLGLLMIDLVLHAG